MDPDVHKEKKASVNSLIVKDKKHNRKVRGKKYSDGYLEEWLLSPIKSDCKSKNSSDKTNSNKHPDKDNSKDITKSVTFSPVAAILSTTSNQLLSSNTEYNISFNTGMVEGTGICINNIGDCLTFDNSGSYRFELTAEVIPYADTNLSVVFYSSSFSADIAFFGSIDLPKKEGKYKIKNISTILPINSFQTVNVRIISPSSQSIILLANTRLLIHRVA